MNSVFIHAWIFFFQIHGLKPTLFLSIITVFDFGDFYAVPHVVTSPGDARFEFSIEKTHKKSFWGFWILSKQDDWSLQKIKCDFGSRWRPRITEEIWTYTKSKPLLTIPSLFSLLLSLPPLLFILCLQTTMPTLIPLSFAAALSHPHAQMWPFTPGGILTLDGRHAGV